MEDIGSGEGWVGKMMVGSCSQKKCSAVTISFSESQHSFWSAVQHPSHQGLHSLILMTALPYGRLGRTRAITQHKGFPSFPERSVTFYQVTKAGQGNNQVFWGPMLSLTDTDFQRPKALICSSHSGQLDNQWKHWGLSPSRLSESLNPSPSDLLSSGVCICNDTQKHFGTLPDSSSKPTSLPHFLFQLLFSPRSSIPFCALMAPFLAYQNIQYFFKISCISHMREACGVSSHISSTWISGRVDNK